MTSSGPRGRHRRDQCPLRHGRRERSRAEARIVHESRYPSAEAPGLAAAGSPLPRRGAAAGPRSPASASPAPSSRATARPPICRGRSARVPLAARDRDPADHDHQRLPRGGRRTAQPLGRRGGGAPAGEPPWPTAPSPSSAPAPASARATCSGTARATWSIPPRAATPISRPPTASSAICSPRSPASTAGCRASGSCRATGSSGSTASSRHPARRQEQARVREEMAGNDPAAVIVQHGWPAPTRSR